MDYSAFQIPEGRVSEYLELKLAGKCVRCRVLLPEGAETVRCERCTRDKAIADGKSIMKQRAARRAKGLCADCPRRSRLYRCPDCAALAKRSTKPRVGQSVGNLDAKIAAATRTHADGRTRYHGRQQRGAPSRKLLDEQDLKTALRALKRGEDMLDAARGPVGDALSKIERRRAESEALAQVQEASRFLDEILERNRVPEETERARGMPRFRAKPRG